MFHPKALHLALAASAALAISAGARSDGTSTADTVTTVTTSKETRAADLTTSDAVRSDRNRRAPTISNAPPAPCQGDITGDRRVDVFDLMQVLMDWGACATEPDLGSIGGRDSTGLRDLSVNDSAGPSLDNGGLRRTADDASTGRRDLSVNDSAGPSIDNGGRRPTADDPSTGRSDLSGKASRRTADDGVILGQVLPCRGDINGDGYVDAQDMVAVLTNFGRSCP